MNLSGWFTRSVTCAAPTGARNSSGDPAFGSQRAINARVEERWQTVKLANGEERQASHVVYSSAAIALGERIWLPGATVGDVNQSREVLDSKPEHNKAGAVQFYKTLVSASSGLGAS